MRLDGGSNLKSHPTDDLSVLGTRSKIGAVSRHASYRVRIVMMSHLSENKRDFCHGQSSEGQLNYLHVN